MNLRDQLSRDEGRRNIAYQDSRGYLTVGVGHKITTPFSDRAIDEILEDDIEDATGDCERAFPWFMALSECRQGVLINMRFNLGLAGLLKFKRMLSALADGDYELTAAEMLDSDWLFQVGDRAKRLAAQMRTDTWQ